MYPPSSKGIFSTLTNSGPRVNPACAIKLALNKESAKVPPHVQWQLDMWLSNLLERWQRRSVTATKQYTCVRPFPERDTLAPWDLHLEASSCFSFQCLGQGHPRLLPHPDRSFRNGLQPRNKTMDVSYLPRDSPRSHSFAAVLSVRSSDCMLDPKCFINNASLSVRHAQPTAAWNLLSLSESETMIPLSSARRPHR